MARVMVRKVSEETSKLLYDSMKQMGLVDTGASSDWMIYQLRYMNLIVTCWTNKKNEHKILFEILEAEEE